MQKKITAAEIIKDLVEAAKTGNVAFFNEIKKKAINNKIDLSNSVYTKAVDNGESLLMLGSKLPSNFYFIKALLDLLELDSSGGAYKDAINFARKDGKTAIHVAIESGSFDSFVEMMSPSMSDLIKGEFEINQKLAFGLTALHMAASSDIKSEKFTEILLLRGADPNIEDQNGNTPLFTAVQKGNFDTAKALLAHSKVSDENYELQFSNFKEEDINILQETFPENKLNRNISALNKIEGNKIVYELNINHKNKLGKDIVDVILESNMTLEKKRLLVNLCFSRGISINITDKNWLKTLNKVKVSNKSELANDLRAAYGFIDAINNDDFSKIQYCVKKNLNLYQSVYKPQSEQDIFNIQFNFVRKLKKGSIEDIKKILDDEKFDFSVVEHLFFSEDKKSRFREFIKNNDNLSEENKKELVGYIQDKIKDLSSHPIYSRLNSKPGLSLLVVAAKKCSYKNFKYLINNYKYVGNIEILDNLHLLKLMFEQNEKMTEQQAYELLENLIELMDKNIRERILEKIDYSLSPNFNKRYRSRFYDFFKSVSNFSEKYPQSFSFINGVINYVACYIAYDIVKGWLKKRGVLTENADSKVNIKINQFDEESDISNNREKIIIPTTIDKKVESFSKKLVV